MAAAKLRWGSEAPLDTDSARARLIDAADACFSKYGVLKTTVEDVASAAKVSRATVYRYFSDRDELILGVLLRQANRFLDRLRVEIEREPQFDKAIVNGVMFTVKAVRADEHLALLFAPEVAGVTTAVAGASQAMFELTTEFLRPFFESARESGALRPNLDVEEAAEWTLRIVLSLLTVEGPATRKPDQERRFLAAYLVPALASGDSVGDPGPATRRRSAPSRRGQR